MHSRLDYCNSVLHSLPWSHLQLLQTVLNSAAQLICGLGRFDHITPALIDLHWLPFPQPISYKICLLMVKCLKGLAPAYLSDLCVGTADVVGRYKSCNVEHHRWKLIFHSFNIQWNTFLIPLISEQLRRSILPEVFFVEGVIKDSHFILVKSLFELHEPIGSILAVQYSDYDFLVVDVS